MVTPLPSMLAARFSSNLTSLESLRRFFAALFDGHIDGNDLVIWGAILLGITCGVLGCFIVLRRQSLLGDAIGHAVLPGVCLGFLVAGERSTPMLLAGALIAGLLAAGLIGLLQRTTTIKAGECMGAIFTGMYGLGIVLLKYVQQRGQSGQSGLEHFLFGQIVGISLSDIALMAVLALLAIGLVVIFWRKLTISSFDESFAASVGIPVRVMHYLLTGLLTVAIVISIQAVGVVLVAAMLVTPAATAYLLTDRLQRMVILSALFGALAGVAGATLSVMGEDLPTGAFIVLGASILFGLAFLFSPRYGVVPRLWRVWKKRRRVQAENLLHSLYLMMEKRGGTEWRFALSNVADERRETPAAVRRLVRLAVRRGWVERHSGDVIVLTDEGVEHARRVVRNHRLWELFLTQEARLADDHVHSDSELIEHVLPRHVLERLEAMLENRLPNAQGTQ